MPSPSSPQTSPTVLVLDDEPGIHRALERLLHLRGFSSLHATTITELIVYAENRHVDAFIIDLNLPGAHTGVDALGWVRLQPQYAATPLLVLTGKTALEEDEEALIRRNDAYVFYKSMSLQPAIAHLERLLRGDAG